MDFEPWNKWHTIGMVLNITLMALMAWYMTNYHPL